MDWSRITNIPINTVLILPNFLSMAGIMGMTTRLIPEGYQREYGF